MNVQQTLSDHVLWSKLVKEIKGRGSKAGIQLASTWSGYIGQKQFVSKENNYSTYKNYIAHIDKSFLDSLFKDLYLASNIAINHGFEHIQLHAAHGYLFNLLIEESFTNYHEYFIKKLREWLAYVKNNHVETSIRISLKAGNKVIDRNLKISENILSLLPDFYDLSDGFYNIDKRLIYPYSKNIDNRIQRQIDISNRYKNQEFISSGHSYGLIRQDLPKNLHVGICRDLIASPNFLQNSVNGGCMKCSKCHYYSRGKLELECPEWE